MIVDSHVHLWDVARMRISWFRDDLGLPACVDGAEWDALAALHGIDAAIAVQAADTLDEARWLSGEIAASPSLAGAVLQYVPEAGSKWAGGMHAALHDGVRGIRLAVASAAPDLADVPGIDALARGLAETGRVLEVLVRPDQLPAVARLAGGHPELTVVACHLGLGARDPDVAWSTALAEVAAQPNAAAKFSGLGVERLRPLADVALNAFGPDRLLFGSDWPMSARIAPYSAVLDATREAIALDTTAPFWGATARRLYGV